MGILIPKPFLKVSKLKKIPPKLQKSKYNYNEQTNILLENVSLQKWIILLKKYIEFVKTEKKSATGGDTHFSGGILSLFVYFSNLKKVF